MTIASNGTRCTRDMTTSAFRRKGEPVPSQDPELWRTHGMELLGPSLLIE